MSPRLLLNLLNELRKTDKMRGLKTTSVLSILMQSGHNVI